MGFDVSHSFGGIKVNDNLKANEIDSNLEVSNNNFEIE